METLNVDANDGRRRKRIEFEAEKVGQARGNAPVVTRISAEIRE